MTLPAARSLSKFSVLLIKVPLRRLTYALILSLTVSTQTLARDDSCAAPGPKGPNALVEALANAKTCKASAAMLSECAWGSSADTRFSATVVSKCEKEFFGKLSLAGQRAYAEEMQLCAYLYSRQSGTMYISAAALCQADVATRFAANPKLAEVPPRRASFDCRKARTPLEKAICADPKVGRADIVLAERYALELKSLEKERSARSGFIASQKKWLVSTAQECGLNDGNAPFSKLALRCVRSEFEARFSALIRCDAAGITPECVDDKQSDQSRRDADISERASFDCDDPTPPLDIAICADAELGQTDIALARVWQEALSTGDEPQRKALRTSQDSWLSFVGRRCPLGAVGGIPPVTARACVRSAFTVRIAQLQTCRQQTGVSYIKCINDFRLLPNDGKNAPTAH